MRDIIIIKISLNLFTYDITIFRLEYGKTYFAIEFISYINSLFGIIINNKRIFIDVLFISKDWDRK